MTKEIYTIRELEILSDVKASSIRMWEKRYSLLTPLRTKTNIRRYTRDDLRKLLQVAFLINLGYKPVKIAALSSDQMLEICESAFINSEINSTYVTELLMRMVEKDVEGFEALLVKIPDKMLTHEYIVEVLEPLIDRIRDLWLVRSNEAFYEEYFLNRIMIKVLNLAEKERKSGRAVREILIFQSDKKTVPAKLSLVYFLAAIKNYKIHYFFNQIQPEALTEMKGRLNPDIVYTEFNDKIADSKLKAFFYALEDSFPAAKNIVSGKIMNDAWKKIPNKVYYIRNLEVLNQSL